MEKQEILDQLLDEWEQGVLAGKPQSLESICANNSELLAALREQVAKLAAIDKRLNLGIAMTVEPDGSKSPAAMTENAVNVPAEAKLGDYELLDEIGRGGMGVVYRARQVSADRIVALKVIRPDRLSSFDERERERTVSRFRQEAIAAAKLSHDHMVTVHEVGEADGVHYYSMRYIEGRSLSEMLTDGPIAPRVAACHLQSVSAAIHYAHENGILHRDLKPANILISAADDRALVADFGLAKLIEGERQLSEAGQVLGSPPYMSPEQTKDPTSVTKATDIYSLGTVFYECLTGQPPFSACGYQSTREKIIGIEPESPRSLNPSVDRDAETIALKCLEKEPARRYATAGELSDDLGRYIRGEPIAARPVGTPERIWRLCRRNPLCRSDKLPRSRSAKVVHYLERRMAGLLGTWAVDLGSFSSK